jgi:hypothetical protein
MRKHIFPGLEELVFGTDDPSSQYRRNAYLTVEQERQFLAPFFARAETGEIATAGEIKRAEDRPDRPRGR